MPASPATLIGPFVLAAVGVATFLLSFRRERHPMTVVERVTAVAKDVRSAATRQVLEDYRDQKAADWVLSQLAPAASGLRFVYLFLTGSAVLSFVIWGLYQWLARDSANGWIFYFAGVVLGGAGLSVFQARATQRENWKKQERAWRDMPALQPAQRVRKKPKTSASEEGVGGAPGTA